jgi:hypothetical protein
MTADLSTAYILTALFLPYLLGLGLAVPTCWVYESNWSRQYPRLRRYSGCVAFAGLLSIFVGQFAIAALAVVS